jgi:hypothetical protein
MEGPLSMSISTRGKTLVALAVVALCAGGGAALHQRDRAEHPPSTALGPPPAFSVIAAGKDVRSEPPQPPTATATRTPIMDRLSPMARYDRLVATGDPVDAKLAYDIAQRCMNSMWSVSRVPPEYTEVSREIARSDCGDLRPGILTNTEQMALAKKAAEAGVHGSWLALFTNQVLRDKTMPPGPETDAYIEHVRQIALSTADPNALLEEATKASELGDKPTALALFVAFRTSQARDRGEGYNPATDPPTQTKAAQLPEAVAKSAIAKGTDYVAKAYRSHT